MMRSVSVRFFILVLLAFAAAFSAAVRAQDNNVSAENASLSMDCPSIASIKNSDSPLVLYAGVRTCINAEQYETAMVLFGLAGVYGKFDAERVMDASSHQAAAVLRRGALESSVVAKKNEFQRRAVELYDNDSARNQLCAQIEKIGPPTYIPSYMLAHGLDAMLNPGKTSSGLVAKFDAIGAWQRAKSGYMKCS